MVVASSWSEQRVLMRAFSGSSDQTRPTIVLHGVQLAIGPAGTDPHGEWGIHVEPPADGRAQELREQLELAARRLAGSKGNPPRLLDEASEFETKATNHWAPGTPPATSQADDRAGYYEPTRVAPPSAPDEKTLLDVEAGGGSFRRGKVITSAPTVVVEGTRRSTPLSAPATAHSAHRGGGIRSAPAAVSNPARRRRGWTSPLPVRRAPLDGGARTVLGFDSGAGGVSSARTSGGGTGATSPSSLARLVGRTMPIGFSLDAAEREVLNSLGRTSRLTATEVASIAGVTNGIQWMETLMNKLSEHGLDLIAPGDDEAGEPTYVLRR